ncbi:MAG: energy transducer TonB [Gammaproteobacteria bacterium]|nr:energy transducer TonB [Gammaproteobacteria bacterium]
MAALVTTSLFYLMQYLISGKHSPLTINQSTNTFDIIRLKRAEDVVTKQRRLPEPPKEPAVPTTLLQPAKTSSKPELITPAFKLPLPGIPSLDLKRDLLTGVSTEIAAPQENNEVIALLKVEPDYPRQAARQGIEGWVKLAFTVLEDGSVADIEVLDASPKRVFDKSAKHAIMRWKFKPRVVNGQAVKQQAVQVIEFKLNK